MDLKQWCVLSVLACALSSAGVASAADLSVSGRIQPGACSLALGKSGTVDLGTISRKDLQETKETRFSRDISLDIRCQAPTKVALRALDNRVGTSSGSHWFGLGASGGKNVGGYKIGPDRRIGDGVELVHLVYEEWPSYGWQVVGDIWTGRYVGPSDLSSWAEPGHTLPQAFQNISGTLAFYIEIAPAKDLDLSQEIAIDGSATMELVYL